MNPNPIFSNLKNYIWNRYENICADFVEHLDGKKHDDEFFETVEKFALEKLTKEAYVELAHHNELVRKSCGFGDCKYHPCCLRGFE
ncbi:hypothetical protein [Nitrososphaeria virus YSH_922147]|uniref:Uncharacterized protein n=1 Tax=Nitrososphaeria virus YSH_922147 TaxID=3071323 RepID=A0A976UAS4_9CAUD|nr:hypothetical protein QKV94_gp51 [Yangshan Harbor Nitrososphaeria virus]UVF62460.1 hypothetical protein [Nitrososphaeria virus YSH_922147]